jgi:hypothetical protein
MKIRKNDRISPINVETLPSQPGHLKGANESGSSNQVATVKSASHFSPQPSDAVIFLSLLAYLDDSMTVGPMCVRGRCFSERSSTITTSVLHTPSASRPCPAVKPRSGFVKISEPVSPLSLVSASPLPPRVASRSSPLCGSAEGRAAP